MRRVLGKEVGPLTCFVLSVTTHPTSCVGLEEVELLRDVRGPSEHQLQLRDL